MRPLLKALLKLLVAADVVLLASFMAGMPLVGVFIALVAFMVGALMTHDWFRAQEHECNRCGRSLAFGRLILLGEWFREDHESCPLCGIATFRAGDHVE